MTAYVIFDVEIRDGARYQDFMDQVKPALAEAGAKYLSRGEEHRVYEGDWIPRRIVILEFPSLEAWETFYKGPIYQGLKSIRDECSSARLVAVQAMLKKAETNSDWRQFDMLVHSDWSVHNKKRWSAIAEKIEGKWKITEIKHINKIQDFLLDKASQNGKSILAGFDFPIGIPCFWYELAGINDFIDFLDDVSLEKDDSLKFQHFFEVADNISDVSYARPFYPNSATKKGEKKIDHLLKKFKCSDAEDLLRECEKAGLNRLAASPLFWTIGAKQVGKAALSGWKEVIIPLYAEGALLWPFQDMKPKEMPFNLMLVETYPAEYYNFIEEGLMKRRSKTRQSDRKEVGQKILTWLEQREVEIEDNLAKQEILEGFGPEANGEDKFDAIVGLCAMLDVVLGNRQAIPSEKLSACNASNLKKEGWIFGMVSEK